MWKEWIMDEREWGKKEEEEVGEDGGRYGQRQFVMMATRVNSTALVETSLLCCIFVNTMLGKVMIHQQTMIGEHSCTCFVISF